MTTDFSYSSYCFYEEIRQLNYIVLNYIYVPKNIIKTGLNWSGPVFNRSWSEPVETGLETAKDRKRPVYCGSVRFFAGLQKMKTGLGLGLWPLRLKTETGPDFQSLLWIHDSAHSLFKNHFIACFVKSADGD